MSLSNLIVPNNIDIFCNNLSTDNFITGLTSTKSYTVITPANSTAPVTFYTLPLTALNGVYTIEFTLFCYTYFGQYFSSGVYQNYSYTISLVNGVTPGYYQGKNINQRYGSYNTQPEYIGSNILITNNVVSLVVVNGFATGGPTGAGPTIWNIQVSTSGPLDSPT